MNLRPEIRTVVCSVPWEPEQIEEIRRAFKPAEFHHFREDDHIGLRLALAQAQVAIIAGDISPTMLANARDLAWIHCDHAGLNKSARPEILASNILVTSSAGRSAPALAQHAFFFVLSFVYDVKGILSRQSAHEWQECKEELRLRGALWGRRLAIVGFGNTGKEMARLGRAFGMHVSVLRRKMLAEGHPDVDRMLSTEGGDNVYKILDCDVIMLAAALTDQTHHLLTTSHFEKMKKTAVLVNMGRGALIDENALTHALQSGQLAGAGLDVFEQEPLPDSSPLWDIRNVIITPHSTPQMPNRTERSMSIIFENIRRYRQGYPMHNLLESRDIYTRGA